MKEMRHQKVDRRKELKAQYKQMKPRMGVFIVRLKSGGRCYIEATQDLRGRINSTRFKLSAGGHPNQELQRDWAKHGGDGFTIEVLEYLEYDEDESKTDYTDDLDLLQLVWEEKLAGEGWESYKKKL